MCLALAGLGYDEGARRELDAALAIAPGLLDDDAAFITDQLRDAPYESRAYLRRRLLSRLNSPRRSSSRPAD